MSDLSLSDCDDPGHREIKHMSNEITQAHYTGYNEAHDHSSSMTVSIMTVLLNMLRSVQRSAIQTAEQVW